VASAHSYILVFTESGRVHWLKVHEIPEAGPAARGKAIVNLLELEANERLATTVAVRNFPEDRYLFFMTENGTVKKTELSAYANPRVGGIIGINVDEGDRLLAVRETDGKKDILIATSKGFAIRFPESDVRPTGRATYGVRGLSLRKDDRVVGMEALDPHGDILTVTERGYGKRTPVEDYRKQSRGGLGIINLKVTPKTGEVVGARHVTESDGLMLITQEGMIIRMNVSGIRVVGRSTQGVRLMNLSGEDRLVSTAKVEREEEALVEANGGDGGDGDGDLAESLVEPELMLEAMPEDDLDLEGEEGEGFEDEGDGGPPDETVH
jgi:DNA gyrase subunit A